MKKTVSLLIALVLFILTFSLWASAANLSDGTYEVPVVLMHKEDEKESFGNKYVAQTALLKVEGDKKTVTILLTTDMKGIEFSYYMSGSLEGDVSKATSVSDVEVAGEIYKQGFEIPVMADGDIGLQFSVPVMPMSPSARLRIDYDKAVSVLATETTTAFTTQITTETTTMILTTVPTTQVSTTTQVEVTETTTASTTQSATTYAETTVYITETAKESTEEEENGIHSIVFVIMFIGATVGLILLLCSDSKEENKNDDK